MKTCKTCKHSRPEHNGWSDALLHGGLVCALISESYNSGQTGAELMDSYPDNPILRVGHEFGCTLHEEKTQK